MDYLFVWDERNGGWWLKLDSVDKLIDYHKKTGNRYAGAFDLFMRLYNKAGSVNRVMDVVMEMPIGERIELMTSRDFKYMQAAILQAQKVDQANIFDGFRFLNMEIGMKELGDIREYGACFINPVGGSTFGIEYKQFVRRKELVFPDFKREDIRIKQFKDGTHWYAYIGDMQVRDGDTLKWNTREEAYNRALAMVE